MEKKNQIGYMAAVFTIFVWGTTYISTKVLLRAFTAVEIMYIRFVLGYIALWIASRKTLKLKGFAEEKYFLAAGLSGITLYFLLENISLTYTLASHAGIIISVAPFFTAVGGWILGKEKKPTGNFLLGFIIAMAGIALLSFQSMDQTGASVFGDVLALLAAVAWAAYSLIMKKISNMGYPTLMVTRRIFFWGLLFLTPCAFFDGLHISMEELLKPVHFGNLLFLGLGASAICFVTWNFAVKRLGAVKTSVFIYMTPVITAATSVIILHEKLTGFTLAGMALTLLGLVLSEKKGKRKQNG